MFWLRPCAFFPVSGLRFPVLIGLVGGIERLLNAMIARCTSSFLNSDSFPKRNSSFACPTPGSEHLEHPAELAGLVGDRSSYLMS
jgi:hypothetical protein